MALVNKPEEFAAEAIEGFAKTGLYTDVAE